MSFLLGGRKKRRGGFAPPPGGGGSRPSFRPGIAGGNRGGGRQGMVMLQRKPKTMDKVDADPQQKTVPAVTPQQQSNGVISMEEGKSSTDPVQYPRVQFLQRPDVAVRSTMISLLLQLSFPFLSSIYAHSPRRLENPRKSAERVAIETRPRTQEEGVLGNGACSR